MRRRSKPVGRVAVVGVATPPVDEYDPATTRYVRAAATGSADGTDWTNAYTTLPATLTRGYTYLVGNGSYAAYTCDDVESGTDVITIRKATVASHGTSTGWSDAYAAQASFGKITVTRDNYVWDGAYRGSDWFDGTAYGFKIGIDTDQQQIVIKNYSNAPDNVTFDYVYCPGWAAALPGTTQRIYAIDVDDSDGGTTSTGLIFRRMYVSGSNNVWFLRTTNGAIVEYCASSGVKSNAENHGEIVNCYDIGGGGTGGENTIVRYNKFKDAYIGSPGTAIVAINGGGTANGLKFYGNVVWDFSVTDAVAGFLGGTAANCLAYNNTFVDSSGGFYQGFQFGGAGCEVKNNLWVNCSNPLMDATTVTHNAYSAASGPGTSTQLNVPTSIFTNYAGDDFTLASATDAGTTLSSPYDQDLLGVTRGQSGWDRGAYEKV